MIQSLLSPTHKISVSVFLLIYLIKTVLLFINKPDALETFKRYTKIPEMIVSVLFLLTGVWMFIEIGNIATLQIIKLVLVFASIPLAVIGFKRNNKALAAVSLLCIFGAYGLAEANAGQKRRAAGNSTVKEQGNIITDPTAEGYNTVKHGEYVYNNLQPISCKNCHGADGKSGVGGASNLSATNLDRENIRSVIKNGRNNGKMPAYASLKAEEYDALADFVLSLRK